MTDADRIAELEAALRDAAGMLDGEDIDPDGIAAERFRAIAAGSQAAPGAPQPAAQHDRIADLEAAVALLKRQLLNRAAAEVGTARLPSWWPQVVDCARAEQRRLAAALADVEPSPLDDHDVVWQLRLRRLVVPVFPADLLHLNALIDVAAATRGSPT